MNGPKPHAVLQLDPGVIFTIGWAQYKTFIRSKQTRQMFLLHCTFAYIYFYIINNN